MSQKNLATVRSLLDAWNSRRDPGLEWYHPDAEWDFTPWEYHVHGQWQGQGEQLEFLGRFLTEWEQTKVEITDLRAAGNQVVAFVRLSAQMRASGDEVSEEGAFLFVLRDGRVAKLTLYRDRDEALRAAGAAAMDGGAGRSEHQSV